MTKTEKKLLAAINWALGANGIFRGRQEGEGPYWWRIELVQRAGLYLDNGKFHIPVKATKEGRGKP